MFALDLSTDQNQLLLPSFPEADLEALRFKLSLLGIKKHFLLSSSGTTGGDWKGYLFSQESLFANANAVNARLQLGAGDVWGASLPHYHIGGLSIHFRAALLHHQPINLRPWKPKELSQKITGHQVTVFSLVPTQVFDLVELKVSAPSCVKAVLVGGDFLGQELAQKFMNLGWPLVRTFGMSEVSSQLATGTNAAGHYSPLPIHEIKTDEEQNLRVKSQSFFSYLVKKNNDWEITPLEEFIDQDGYFKLPDKGVMIDRHLKVLGRDDGLIKSAGHLMNFLDLKEALDRFSLAHHCWGKIELKTSKSDREGHFLTLHCLREVPEALIKEFIEEISPIRVKFIKWHETFARTDLGKFKTEQT